MVTQTFDGIYEFLSHIFLKILLQIDSLGAQLKDPASPIIMVSSFSKSDKN